MSMSSIFGLYKYYCYILYTYVYILNFIHTFFEVKVYVIGFSLHQPNLIKHNNAKSFNQKTSSFYIFLCIGL